MVRYNLTAFAFFLKGIKIVCRKASGHFSVLSWQSRTTSVIPSMPSLPDSSISTPVCCQFLLMCHLSYDKWHNSHVGCKYLFFKQLRSCLFLLSSTLSWSNPLGLFLAWLRSSTYSFHLLFTCTGSCSSTPYLSCTLIPPLSVGFFVELLTINLPATKLFIVTSVPRGGGYHPPRFRVRFKILYRVIQVLIQHCLLRRLVYLNII